METRIRRKETAKLPTEYGDFDAIVYECIEGLHHIALVKGDIKDKDVLVRVHSECLTGDVFHSSRCDCNQQLDKALKTILKEMARGGFEKALTRALNAGAKRVRAIRS